MRRDAQHPIARERAAALARLNEEIESTLDRSSEALERQQRQVLQLREEIRALFARVDETYRPTNELTRERDLLQEWYDNLLPVAATLTPQSFAYLQGQLEALAAEGLITPDPRPIRSFIDLRNRLSAVLRELAEERRRAEAEQATLLLKSA